MSSILGWRVENRRETRVRKRRYLQIQNVCWLVVVNREKKRRNIRGTFASLYRVTFHYWLSNLINIKMDFFSNIPTHMDYKGQGRSEKLSRMIITLFGVVGLVWGYYIQQFSATVYVLGAGFLLASILTIPPWPMYRRKPLNWQKPRPSPREDGAETQSPKSKKKK